MFIESPEENMSAPIGHLVDTPCETTRPTSQYRPVDSAGRYKYRVVMEAVGHDHTGQPFREDLQVLHHCDNPACFRWDHLFIGTVTDNMQDMIAKNGHHNSNRSHCRRGHPYDEENLYVTPSTGARQCLACRKIVRSAR